MRMRDEVTGAEYRARVVPAGTEVDGVALNRVAVFVRLRDRWVPLAEDQVRFVAARPGGPE